MSVPGAEQKPQDFAEAVKNYTEITIDAPAIKLGKKNQAKLEKIRKLNRQMRGH